MLNLANKTGACRSFQQLHSISKNWNDENNNNILPISQHVWLQIQTITELQKRVPMTCRIKNCTWCVGTTRTVTTQRWKKNNKLWSVLLSRNNLNQNQSNHFSNFSKLCRMMSLSLNEFVDLENGNWVKYRTECIDETQWKCDRIQYNEKETFVWVFFLLIFSMLTHTPDYK